MTAEEFTEQLRQDGFEQVLTREQPADYFLGDHQHEFDARALILAGEITLTVSGQPQSYPRGTVFALDAGCVHTERAGPQGVTYLVGRRQSTAR